MMRKNWQILLVAAAFFTACAGPRQVLTIADSGRTFASGTIFDTNKKAAIAFETLVEDLARVRVVYVGEQHTNPEHHRIQLRILKALDLPDRPLTVGMEMFDTTYAPVLSRWRKGELTEQAFIERTHWYANWRYDFNLYRKILEAVRRRRIPLYGLNIPFHIPPKIAAGGIDSLLWPDRQFVPDQVDLTDARHRAYVKKIFSFHHMPGTPRFDFFYEAQCVWEDTMAESIARYLGRRRMLVLAGNGHIIGKFGIPDRAFRRTGAPFKTVLLVPAGDKAELTDADYIWVTAPR